jgi:hypothetical protein
LTTPCSMPACISFKPANRLAGLSFIGTMLLMSTMASAQSSPAGAVASVVDPARATTPSPQPIFTLEATAGDAIAAASVGWEYGDLLLDGRVSGPISKSTGEALFADLDGLRNQTTIEGGAHYVLWNPADPTPLLAPACQRLATLQNVLLSTIDCTLSNLRAKQRELRVSLVPAYDPGTAALFGARYKFGRKDFDYLNSTTLSPESETHTNWSLAVGTAVLTSGNWLLGAGYRREQRYSAGADPLQLCVPLTGTDAATCSEATLAAPILAKVNQVYGEVRKFFGPIAVSPRFSRDLTRDITGIEVPLYFLRNSDGGFTGGVRVGWRSDTKSYTVVAFVGQVLGLLSTP